MVSGTFSLILGMFLLAFPVHSQPAIINFCTSTTTDDDFIWSKSPSDDNITESSIDYLAGKVDADNCTTPLYFPAVTVNQL